MLLSDPLQKKPDNIYSETSSIFNKCFCKGPLESHHQIQQLFSHLSLSSVWLCF